MAVTVAEAFVSLRPDTKNFASEAKRGIGGVFPGIAKAAAAGMAVVGGMIAGTAVKGIQAFAQFERGMNEVFTLLPGISGDAMKEMEKQVLALSKEMGTLPEDVVPALYQALSAGVPQDNVFAFLETANKAAIGGITDIETSVNAITGVVNAYGADVIDAQQASDLMFTTVRLGKTDFEQLAGSLSNVLPFASAAGVNFENISAAMSTLTAVTGQTSESTTKLRALIVELSDSGKGVGEVFEKVAGESFKDFMAGGGNLQEALQALADHADDSGLSIDQLFGSVEAGAGALVLTGAASDSFTAALEEMGTSAGATETAYAQMDQGLGRAMDKIKAGWEVLKVSIGERLAPVVERFADWVIENMPAIEAAIGDAIDGIERWITDTAIPAFQSMYDWWQDNGDGIVTFLGHIVDAMAWVGETIGILAGTTKTEADKMKGEYSSLADGASSAQGEIRRELLDSEAVSKRWATSATTDMGNVQSWLHVTFVPAWKGGWAQIDRFIGRSAVNAQENATAMRVGFDTLTTALSTNIERMRTGFGTLRDAFTETRDTAREKFHDIAYAMADWRDDVVQVSRELPGRILTAIGDLGSLLYQKGKDLIGGFVKGIGDAAKGIGSGIGGAVSSAASAVWNAFGDGPGRPPGGGGKALSRVQQVLGPGTYITSTYRTPAHNRRVGGSPTSYHLDRNNPAVDIGGSTAALNRLAPRLKAMGGWREFLWQVKGHYDHIHVAHKGGTIGANGLIPLKSDERLIKGQVGETILPKGYSGGGFPERLTLVIEGRPFTAIVAEHDRQLNRVAQGG